MIAQLVKQFLEESADPLSLCVCLLDVFLKLYSREGCLCGRVRNLFGRLDVSVDLPPYPQQDGDNERGNSIPSSEIREVHADLLIRVKAVPHAVAHAARLLLR